MESEIAPLPDSSTTDEMLKDLEKVNRIVVYGSRLSGAFTLAKDFEEYLKDNGVPDAQVHTTRNVAAINDAFFDINHTRQQLSEILPLEPKTTKSHKLLSLFGRKSNETNSSSMQVPDSDNPEKQTPTLPRGVIVFPEMRQYDLNDHGMNVESPIEAIKALCDQYGVPVHQYSNETTDENIRNDAMSMLTSTTSSE